MNDEKGLPVEEAVRRAREYFIQKYGDVPNSVEVHPGNNPGGISSIDKYSIVVTNNSRILPNHLLIGVSE